MQKETGCYHFNVLKRKKGLNLKKPKKRFNLNAYHEGVGSEGRDPVVGGVEVLEAEPVHQLVVVTQLLDVVTLQYPL